MGLPDTKLHKFMTWLWYWLPPLMLMGLIFSLSSRSSLPQAQDERTEVLVKKSSHIMEYTLLFLLLVRAWGHSLGVRWPRLNRSGDSSSPRRLLRVDILGMGQSSRLGRALRAALLTTAAYGVSDEVHQSFVPRRHANWYDVVIDVAVPLLLCLLWYGRRRLVRPRDPDLTE
jgi:VanZ family protein